eukprot:9467040-Alexandrium_andersonii.AAC.1
MCIRDSPSPARLRADGPRPKGTRAHPWLNPRILRAYGGPNLRQQALAAPGSAINHGSEHPPGRRTP